MSDRQEQPLPSFRLGPEGRAARVRRPSGEASRWEDVKGRLAGESQPGYRVFSIPSLSACGDDSVDRTWKKKEMPVGSLLKTTVLSSREIHRDAGQGGLGGEARMNLGGAGPGGRQSWEPLNRSGLWDVRMPPQRNQGASGVGAERTASCHCWVGPGTRPAPMGQVVAEAPGTWPPLPAPPYPEAGRATLTNGPRAHCSAQQVCVSLPALLRLRLACRSVFSTQREQGAAARSRGGPSPGGPPAGRHPTPAPHLPAAHGPRRLLQPDLPLPGTRGNLPQLPCPSPD